MLQLNELSANKYFFGIVMITINIGSRFIFDELSDKQKKCINSKLVRRIVIFCIFFMATRDILASITLTLIFILFISDIFREEDTKLESKHITSNNQSIIKDITQKIKDIESQLSNIS